MSKALLRNSGPLSIGMTCGLPRFASTALSTRITRSLIKEVSVSIAQDAGVSNSAVFTFDPAKEFCN